jgi:hypothetical protein
VDRVSLKIFHVLSGQHSITAYVYLFFNNDVPTSPKRRGRFYVLKSSMERIRQSNALDGESVMNWGFIIATIGICFGALTSIGYLVAHDYPKSAYFFLGAAISAVVTYWL